MLSVDMQDRLNLLLAMRCPIFVIGNNVVLPAEADEMFSPDEIKTLEAYILSSMNERKD